MSPHLQSVHIYLHSAACNFNFVAVVVQRWLEWRRWWWLFLNYTAINPLCNYIAINPFSWKIKLWWFKATALVMTLLLMMLTIMTTRSTQRPRRRRCYIISATRRGHFMSVQTWFFSGLDDIASSCSVLYDNYTSCFLPLLFCVVCFKVWWVQVSVPVSCVVSACIR